MFFVLSSNPDLYTPSFSIFPFYFSVTKRPANLHESYHAHVYYDETNRDFARQLCTDVGDRFGLQIGRFHDKPIGPHPMWSCQIMFDSRDFDVLIPWMDENRNGLSVLVHGLTGNDLKDHTDYAYWLGSEHALNLSIFKESEKSD